ncbi:metallophosphoesterase family protein [Paraburkholderia sp. GAS32]|uniref:metallophosphoesterase family protein n=1 Tax=Paraburkholderia sp. GAS32 TaxID=3035129 RepID=UPI003D24C467
MTVDNRAEKRIRVAVLSDLHYDRPLGTQPSRPSIARNGPAGDPMQALLNKIAQSQGDTQLRADYLLCGGDITNKANPEGFLEGWRKLKELQNALGARHLLAVTGNHEVNSRAGEKDDEAGNSERALDPLAVIQRHADYPSTTFADGDQRWVYWGRGFLFIEEQDILFLLVNSSHFHPTTRQNEFERGRVGDVALQLLRQELKPRVEANRSRAFIALMHHHPIPYEPLDMAEDRINMYNGSQLMESLQETGVSWLVIHGHKHFPRLIPSQGGMGSPFVFAVGSFGAFLDGDLALKTQLQFYIAEIELQDQTLRPKAKGHVRAMSWSGSTWAYNNVETGGLPDRCGYQVPGFDLENVIDKLAQILAADTRPYLSWDETLQCVPELRYTQPTDARFLRRILESRGIGATWPDGEWFPTEVSK